MKEFVFPTEFIWEKETYRNNYGKITIQPLERGYGVTVGNALRRVLLSSIPGVAITALKIEGVPHEFSSVEGMKEDVIEIILNIKQMALKPVISEFPHIVKVEIEGKEEITAGDLIPDGSVEVLNKNLHIATVDPEKKFKFELEITKGFGYLPQEKMKLMGKEYPIGTILIDGLYSPVRKVTFYVENTRVGQFVDYEKLILELWTTGAVTPQEAVTTATEILNKHFTLIGENQIIGEKVKEAKEEEKKEPDLEIPISELKLSTRVCNALSSRNIKTLKDLLNTPKEKFEEIKNLGKKSIEEIEEALKKRGYRLLTFSELSEKKEVENET
ncbi:DNA-directed RNA polymerase subunit alpha [bacterium]|nr:DNA-directed RNA polymerase subunit alpha [bacterium]